jgi:cell wall-associated NlpC family hydrolase
MARPRWLGATALVAAGAVAAALAAPRLLADGQTNAAEPGPVHVHALGLNPGDDSLFIATDTGLFRLEPNAERAERYQDTMGFTVAGPDHFLGSGHPDLRDDLPPLLGLIESRDAGETWTPISLLGKADFHALRLRGDLLVGYDATSGRVMISRDRGGSWRSARPPEPLVDLVIDPTSAQRLLAAGESRLFSSGDGDSTWKQLEEGTERGSWPGRGATGSICSTGAAVFGSAPTAGAAGSSEATSADPRRASRHKHRDPLHRNPRRRDQALTRWRSELDNPKSAVATALSAGRRPTQALGSRVMPRSRAIAIATALSGALVAGSGADANPDVRAKQAQAQAIVAQVQALGEEVGAAAERFNGANYRLQQLTSELRITRRDLGRARSMHRAAQSRLADRLVQLYTSDEPGALEVLLGAESLDEVLDTLETRERVAEQDVAIVEQVRAYRTRISRRAQQLRRARAEQAAVVKQRAEERAAIEAKLAERQRLLQSVRTEITRLQAQERARQAELERRARAALAARRRTMAAAAQRDARPHEAHQDEPASVAAQSRDPSAPSTTPPPADASRGAQVVAIAMRYLGVPYKWGGASPETGFDCSGLTMYVYAQIGISLPHYAAAQYQMGVPVSRDQLQPGDLVFYRGLGHMGMYLGGGNYIHAPQTGDVVKISSVSGRSDWVGARRIL